MSKMDVIRELLKQIEEMKRTIALTHCNEHMPYAIKTKKLWEMQVALQQTEHHTLNLLEEELKEA